MTTTARVGAGAHAPASNRILALETPFGRPVDWAGVALVSDIGDSHELNDDRCLVITCKDLGERVAPPLRDFMLCVLADGATGSTFGPASVYVDAGQRSRQAGWRASQLAQGAFVERFLASAEVDILDRLKDGLRAADAALIDSREGRLSTTLVVLFVSADGTAYAASIGDSVMLVLPPKRKAPADRRLKKLGYEDSTSVGSGDTTLLSVDENQLIEQWWPNKEGGSNSTRVAPGTYIVLMSDGIADSLSAEFVDQLLHRHSLDSATIALPMRTRERRMQTQKRGGGSTQELGLDNMSAIVVRFDGLRRAGRPATAPRIDDASLIGVLGTHGGPTPDAGGTFGMLCLAGQEQGTTAAPSFVRHFLESEHRGSMRQRFTEAWLNSRASRGQARLAVLAVDEQGSSHTFSMGGAEIGPIS